MVKAGGGVATPARRVTMNYAAYLTLPSWGTGGACVTASDLQGSRARVRP